MAIKNDELNATKIIGSFGDMGHQGKTRAKTLEEVDNILLMIYRDRSFR